VLGGAAGLQVLSVSVMGLATFEAIARAFGILESPDVQVALERVFAAMVERTLWARGQIAREAVTSGVPEGTFRHLPFKF
jgi:hypothetical protein